MLCSPNLYSHINACLMELYQLVDSSTNSTAWLSVHWDQLWAHQYRSDTFILLQDVSTSWKPIAWVRGENNKPRAKFKTSQTNEAITLQGRVKQSPPPLFSTLDAQPFNRGASQNLELASLVALFAVALLLRWVDCEHWPSPRSLVANSRVSVTCKEWYETETMLKWHHLMTSMRIICFLFNCTVPEPTILNNTVQFVDHPLPSMISF